MPVAEPVVSLSIAGRMLAEFEEQAPLTRKFLERLPEDKYTWKPHPKSLTAGQLAYHLAFVPGSVALAAAKNPAPAPDFNALFIQPASRQVVLEKFEESIATVRELLPRFEDPAMFETWRLMAGERELVAMPRGKFLREIMLCHWYQHRGQFSVYLRILDVPVPSTWGPSADERPAGM
ncbi:MAG TPA: DinB family protein [Terracidiphilus sp.]|nr:DinB family protein [Terracidiphilus sp.]